MRFRSTTLLLIAGLTIHAQAADPDVKTGFTDLRLEASVLDDTLDVDATATGALGSVSRSGEAEFEDAWRVGIVGVSARSNDSGILTFGSGGGLHYSRWHDGGDVDETVEAVTASIRLGLVIQPAPIFHVEVMPYGAIGGARGEIEDEESDIELYWEFGGIAAAFLTFGNLQVGAHVGYLWAETELEYDSDANFPTPVEDATIELQAEGAFFGVSLGGRF